MLILYSVFLWNDSIGIFMRYPCLKIMSIFHITLILTYFRIKTSLGFKFESANIMNLNKRKTVFFNHSDSQTDNGSITHSDICTSSHIEIQLPYLNIYKYTIQKNLIFDIAKTVTSQTLIYYILTKTVTHS